MKKFKHIVFGLCCVLVGAVISLNPTSTQSSNKVYASVADEGRYKELNTQSVYNTYDKVGTYNLYVDGNADESEKLYTIRLTNATSWEVVSTMTGSYEFFGDATLKVEGTVATSASKRNPRATTLFSISDTLLKASKNGYLTVTVQADLRVDNDEAYLSFQNGTFSSSSLNSLSQVNSQVTSSSITSSDFTTASLSLSNMTANGYMVLFVGERKSDSTNTMYVNTPKVTISSSDVTAPTISASIDDTNWSSSDKTLTINVDDNQSGIQYVKVNGEKLTLSDGDDNQSNVYTYQISENGVYTIEACDNIGNISKYNYTEDKIDKTDLSTLIIDMPISSHSKTITFSTTFESDNLSQETIYYTIDGTTPTTSSNTLINGTNTLYFENNGDYTLKAIVADEVGHVSSVYSKYFRIDDTRYEINVTSYNGSYEIIGGSLVGDETAFHAWYGDTITIKFTPDEDYVFYQLLRNGKKENTDNGEYSYTCLSDMNLVIQNRFNVQMTSVIQSYEFNPDTPPELEYTLNTEDVEIDIIIKKDNVATILYNVGTYAVSWSIDNESYIGSGSFEVEVTPIEIELNYLDLENFVYNGEVQSISFEAIQGLDFEVSYYIDDTLAEFKDAGQYTINVICTDSNYLVTNSEFVVSIAQREINVLVTKTTFDYTSEIQSIEYSLSEEIEHEIKYYLDDEESDFLNAGTYVYEIYLADTKNYSITNFTGEAVINKVEVYITVSKTEYDYLGRETSIEYTLKDENDNEITFVNGLSIIYMVGDNQVEFKDPQDYTYEFSTTDENYILYNTTGNASIVMVSVFIFVEELEYEYTGEVITLNYYFENESGYRVDAGNIHLNFYVNNEQTEFKNVNTYNYEFSTEDINYKLYSAKGTAKIIPAQLNIVVNQCNYIYNEEGYIFDYSILSNKGTDYSKNNLISLAFSLNDEETILDNVGEYNYQFISLDENIILNGNIAGDIVISPKEIQANVITTYTYTGGEIAFEYELVQEIEIILTIDILLDAKNYNFEIKPVSENYVILGGVGVVVVNPKEVSILSMDSDFVYNGEEQVISVELSEDILYNIIYVRDEEETAFINAGEYNVTISSADSNYVIVDNIKVISISPKPIEITVSDLEYTYDKTSKNISVITSEDVSYEVNYFIDDQEADETISAGEYGFVVNITNSNYIGSCNGVMTILPKSAKIIVESDQYKTYGKEDGEFKYSITGLCDGDEIEVELAREAGENVGVYFVSLVSAINNNYQVEFEGNYYKIIAKKIIVIADSQSKIFGENDCELTYRVFNNELVGSDKLNGSLVREEGEDVGSYNILVGSLSNSNYQIVYRKATFTINPKPLQIIIDNINVIYGENAELTYTTNESYDASLIFGELVREEGENVGYYKISQGSLNSKNYALEIVDGVYTISPKTLIINALYSERYYGEEDNLMYEAIGLIGTDTLSGSLSREEGEDVGEYEILQGTLDNSNYVISFNSNYLKIEKAKLSIEIDDIEQVYGEDEKEYTYRVYGMKFEEKLELKLFREFGENVGEYQISCAFAPMKNYTIDNLKTGVYKILKANIVPVLTSDSVVYTGDTKVLEAENFPFELKYIYKLNGIEVSEMTDVGTYTVQAVFEGNQNYFSSKSNIVSFTIQKQKVYFTLGENNFIYNGEVQFPEYYYDISTGLKDSSIIFEFEDNIEPREIGTYDFTLKVVDDNYIGETTGIVTIAKAFEIVTEDESIIECEEATFDESAQNIKFVKNETKGKFNNQKILSTYSFDNVETTSNYVYTIKVKANENANNVYVYQLNSDNSYTEMVVTLEGGYYIFKVDSLDSSYIITQEIEPISVWVWVAIIVGAFVIFIIVMSALKIAKARKLKKSKVSSEDIDNFNIN